MKHAGLKKEINATLMLDDSDEQYPLEFQTCQTLSEVAALLLHFGGTHRKH
jgi:hypothetical protein